MEEETRKKGSVSVGSHPQGWTITVYDHGRPWAEQIVGRVFQLDKPRRQDKVAAVRQFLGVDGVYVGR